MDGLDSVPGVIVIGATNRIESVDPALRRAGRFDRELYFPPALHRRPQGDSAGAHAELEDQAVPPVRRAAGRDDHRVLRVGPAGPVRRSSALRHEAAVPQHTEVPAGGEGEDRSERAQSQTGPRAGLDLRRFIFQIDESDFLNARKNLIPSSHKLGNRMRKLSATVAPLLQRQLEMILSRLKMLWPHFSVQFHK
jgi:hypothetical protein